MKKTKIICSMGPNTNDKELMKNMALSGMNIARFNFSHGDYEEHLGRYKILEEVRKETGLQIAALLDTKGPEIRTGVLVDGKKVTLEQGQTYVLSIHECVGDKKKGFINYAGLAEDIAPGNTILIDDGLIELRVESVENGDITCTVLNGGELGERKGVNVPGVSVKLPPLTDKDKEDLRFGADLGFEFIAASFVRNAAAIREIREIVAEKNANMKIIAKIENQEGIDNIDEILELADGIMVARGDMGVEIPAEKVPAIQKMLIQKCNLACKPVVTATQMLDSMIRNPRPTRAEVADVANAIYDGTDAIMLSGESAMGKYPLEALQTMARIAEETEKHLNSEAYKTRHIDAVSEKNISNQVSYSAVATADALGAKAIVAPTISGFTARMLSKWRPSATIYGLSPSEKTIRQMQLYWGVVPVQSKRSDSTDNLLEESVEIVKELAHLQSGDIVVTTAGIVQGKADHLPVSETNSMRVVTVQ